MRELKLIGRWIICVGDKKIKKIRLAILKVILKNTMMLLEKLSLWLIIQPKT
jgi:hypothetical protein